MKHTAFLKMVTLLLVFSMLATLLISCADNGTGAGESTADPSESTSGQGDAGTGDGTPNETEDPEQALIDGLPSGDYTGQTFNILNLTSTWALTTVFSDGINGDTINDAIFERNEAVATKLGVTIMEEETSSLTNIRNYNIAQDKTFDCFFTEIANGCTLTTEKMLYDWNNAPNMDLEKPWWYADTVDSVNLGDATYLLFSDMHLHFHEAFYIVAFSKGLISQFSLDDPYDLVRNNKWTIDKFYEMMQAVADDTNGDQVYSVAEDRFGLSGHSNIGYSMLISLDASYLAKDGLGAIYFNPTDERFLAAYEKLTRYFYANTLAITTGNPKISFDGSDSDAAFRANRSLFMIEVTGALKEHRENENEYGIVVTPKFDEQQEEYYSPITNSPGTLCTWAHLGDEIDYISTVLENMAGYSYQILKPAYYDVLLYYKYAKDEESISMLEQVYKNGRFEIGNIYNFGSIRNNLESMMKGGNTEISSILKTHEKAVNKAISKALDALGVPYEKAG